MSVAVVHRPDAFCPFLYDLDAGDPSRGRVADVVTMIKTTTTKEYRP